ncbi:Holliday junction resolvase Hjc [Pyrolobus fumarii]|uniref:Holliday junction resolvase Hjc n=1 Tax=Pyrolobus fumarii TaxID=54252 RepID=UPI00064FAB30|nr:Holliday junction resolvase Hjc [Pyrolobus fumarii]
MPEPRSKKGFQKERDLVLRFWKAGFAAVRGPASGARAKRIVYPDVLAIYNGSVFVFEVKYRAKPETIYIEKSKLERLEEFARRAGGKLLIAVKYGGEEWRFVDPGLCPETNGGKIRVDPRIVAEKGIPFSQFVNEVKGQTRITRFMRKT